MLDLSGLISLRLIHKHLQKPQKTITDYILGRISTIMKNSLDPTWTNSSMHSKHRILISKTCPSWSNSVIHIRWDRLFPKEWCDKQGAADIVVVVACGHVRWWPQFPTWFWDFSWRLLAESLIRFRDWSSDTSRLIFRAGHRCCVLRIWRRRQLATTHYHTSSHAFMYLEKVSRNDRPHNINIFKLCGVNHDSGIGSTEKTVGCFGRCVHCWAVVNIVVVIVHAEIRGAMRSKQFHPKNLISGVLLRGVPTSFASPPKIQRERDSLSVVNNNSSHWFILSVANVIV